MKWRLTIGLCALGFVGYGIYSHMRHLQYVDDLRWLSARQDRLSQIRNEVCAYARQHEGTFPSTLEELIAIGILSEQECNFIEVERGCSVRLRYRRPVSGAEYQDPILLVEEYGPPRDGGNIVRVGGSCFFVRDVLATVRRDNQQGHGERGTVPPG